MNVKIDRINHELQRQISEIISQEIKDPRIGNAVVGITKVSTTPDLKYSKIFVSIYSKDTVEQKEAFDTIVRSSQFIRNALKNKVKMRVIPELHFIQDKTEEHGSRIDEILRGLNIPNDEEEK